MSLLLLPDRSEVPLETRSYTPFGLWNGRCSPQHTIGLGERLYVELPADDTPAIELFRARGFKEVARFGDYILDRKGKYHDLVVLHLDLIYRD